MTGDDAARSVENLARTRERILKQLQKVIIGQSEVIELILMALFTGGHCLIIGVPGLAKTLIVRTLAEILDLQFSRIQFTPDLMPSDITGTEIIQEGGSAGRELRFVKGPVFGNLVLADEINRAPPKTQAALLQAMQELTVTAGGQTHELERPFLVLATQNPIEQEGTYPLPEAQLDRFMFSVDVRYPSFDEEVEVVRRTTTAEEATLKAVAGAREVRALQRSARAVPASEHVVRYAVRLVQASRPNGEGVPDVVQRYVSWGAGPRAGQFLILGGKARALLDGRPTVDTEDVRALAPHVLGHRVIVNYHAEAEKVPVSAILSELVEHVRP